VGMQVRNRIRKNRNFLLSAEAFANSLAFYGSILSLYQSILDEPFAELGAPKIPLLPQAATQCPSQACRSLSVAVSTLDDRDEEGERRVNG
jgi:hypothetical protein